MISFPSRLRPARLDLLRCQIASPAQLILLEAEVLLLVQPSRGGDEAGRQGVDHGIQLLNDIVVCVPVPGDLILHLAARRRLTPPPTQPRRRRLDRAHGKEVARLVIDPGVQVLRPPQRYGQTDRRSCGLRGTIFGCDVVPEVSMMNASSGPDVSSSGSGGIFSKGGISRNREIAPTKSLLKTVL